MDNIKESKGPLFAYIVFLIAGCLVACGGIYCGIYLAVTMSKFVPVTATITEIEVYSDSHTAYVSFEFDGKTYEPVF